MKTSELKKILRKKSICVDMISKNKKGNMLLRKGFFYTNGYNEDKFAEVISKTLTEAKVAHTIVERGEHWTAFRGGAKLQDQSHWFVEVKINEAI